MKLVLATLTAMLFMAPIQSALAETAAVSQPPAQQPQLLDPREQIQQGVSELQAFLSADTQANPAQIHAFLEQKIAPYFDFNIMSQLVMGPLNYQISEQQRLDAQALIKKTFLESMASNLSNYRGGKVEYLKVSGNIRHGKVNVRLAIYRPNEYPTELELRFARGPEGWKIFDVSANGMSAVAHYRNYVRSVVQRSGLDGLTQ